MNKLLDALYSDSDLATYNKITILHHDDADGFGSAFAIWSHLNEVRKARLTCIPVQYGQPVPEIPEDTTFLMILDFSYSREVCEELHERFPNMVIIDHHKTAEKELKGLDYAIFDMLHSGCVMSWRWAHVNMLSISAGTPDILRYVEDRDLWSWKLEDSKNVNLAIASMPATFQAWSSFSLPEARLQGAAIAAFQEDQIQRSLGNMVKAVVGGVGFALVNCTANISEVGNSILDRHPDVDVACMWYESHIGVVKVSLRSRKGSVDVSTIAKNFNGGGHAAAAGFEMRRNGHHSNIIAALLGNEAEDDN